MVLAVFVVVESTSKARQIVINAKIDVTNARPKVTGSAFEAVAVIMTLDANSEFLLGINFGQCFGQFVNT